MITIIVRNLREILIWQTETLKHYAVVFFDFVFFKKADSHVITWKDIQNTFSVEKKQHNT